LAQVAAAVLRCVKQAPERPGRATWRARARLRLGGAAALSHRVKFISNGEIFSAAPQQNFGIWEKALSHCGKR
jgi:hypothetical protein